MKMPHELMSKNYCGPSKLLPLARIENKDGFRFIGIDKSGGNRWMCPECNCIHAPTECSVWDGLHYPACCSTSAGNRLNYGIKTS